MGYITVYIPAGSAHVRGILQCTFQLGRPMYGVYYSVHSSWVSPCEGYYSVHSSWVGPCMGYITVYIPAGLAHVWGILQCTFQLGQPMWAAILQCLGWLMQVPYYNAHSSQVNTGAILYNTHYSWVSQSEVYITVHILAGPSWCHITMFIADGSANVSGITVHIPAGLAHQCHIIYNTYCRWVGGWEWVLQCTFQLGPLMQVPYYNVYSSWVSP